jgi:hypothetical protein
MKGNEVMIENAVHEIIDEADEGRNQMNRSQNLLLN